MAAVLGILAFGSLIEDPGAEIEAVLVGRKPNVWTPFCVEFARGSIKRGGAPTLVPVERGGTPVLAQILLVNVSEQEAKDRLWLSGGRVSFTREEAIAALGVTPRGFLKAAERLQQTAGQHHLLAQ